MTRDEERAVEQRTRIREARFMLRSIADDSEPPSPEIETELRTMSRRLQEIETRVGESYSVRKSRAGKEST